MSPPKQLIGMLVWSLAKVGRYLVAQKIVGSISLDWLRQVLRERNVRWRRTKSWKESNGVRHAYTVYDLERDALAMRLVSQKNWVTFLATAR